MSTYEEWKEYVQQIEADKQLLHKARWIVWDSTEFLVGAPIKDINGKFWWGCASYIFDQLTKATESEFDTRAEIELAKRIIKAHENRGNI